MAGIALIAGVLLVSPAACSSVYHETVRGMSGSADELLARRAAESVAMHRETAVLLRDAAAAFEDPWMLDHPLLLWKRLEDRRHEASGTLWEARKRTASIGDVLDAAREARPGTPPGEIDPVQEDHARAAMRVLDEAADSLDGSLSALAAIVESWKGEMTPEDFDPGEVTAALAGVDGLLDEAASEAAAIGAAP